EIDRPCDAFALVKRDRQALGRVELLPLTLLLRPREVIGAGAVACLARDVYLRIGRGKTASGGVVVLAQVGRMAIGAHVVPVLIDAGPVASIMRRDLFPGIQKEPPLAATFA